MLGIVEELKSEGVPQKQTCELLGISPRTLQKWRKQGIGEDRRTGPKSPPKNKLTERERKMMLEILNSPEFRDLSPKQIVPRLADRGLFVASESTMYRVLREEGQNTHREKSRPPVKRAKPAPKVATAPNQVWCWDITYLKTMIGGVFFYLYVVLDVWSRKIVAWEIFDAENAENSILLFRKAFSQDGVDPGKIILHNDRGGPMKHGTFKAFLENLGVFQSFSRPRVSDDNPFIEAAFRTVKYRPGYPDLGFETMEDANAWMNHFVDWYNNHHLHSAIRFVTPNDRHEGREKEILANRKRVYEEARKLHPERWSRGTRNWEPISEVVLNPSLEMASGGVA